MIRRLLIATILLLSPIATPGQTRQAPRVPRPTIVSAREWNSQPQPIPDSRGHEPKVITIHHAGVLWKTGDDPAAKILGLQKWGQREKGWPDVPYHFLIAPDGRIFEGRPIEYEPESNTKYELKGNVGIELWGDFEQQRVNAAQLKSLVSIAAWICSNYRIDPKTIRGHKDLAPTACPGKDLYRYVKEGDVQRWTAAILAGDGAAIDLRAPLDGGPEPIIKP